MPTHTITCPPPMRYISYKQLRSKRPFFGTHQRFHLLYGWDSVIHLPQYWLYTVCSAPSKTCSTMSLHGDVTCVQHEFQHMPNDYSTIAVAGAISKRWCCGLIYILVLITLDLPPYPQVGNTFVNNVTPTQWVYWPWNSVIAASVCIFLQSSNYVVMYSFW